MWVHRNPYIHTLVVSFLIHTVAFFSASATYLDQNADDLSDALDDEQHEEHQVIRYLRKASDGTHVGVDVGEPFAIEGKGKFGAPG